MVFPKLTARGNILNYGRHVNLSREEVEVKFFFNDLFLSGRLKKNAV
jgi:hypothetical protein